MRLCGYAVAAGTNASVATAIVWNIRPEYWFSTIYPLLQKREHKWLRDLGGEELADQMLSFCVELRKFCFGTECHWTKKTNNEIELEEQKRIGYMGRF